MTTDGKIRDEALRYDINREATKISTLSSGKIDKYEYLNGKEIAFEKQTKTTEEQGEKQVKVLKNRV